MRGVLGLERNNSLFNGVQKFFANASWSGYFKDWNLVTTPNKMVRVAYYSAVPWNQIQIGGYAGYMQAPNPSLAEPWVNNPSNLTVTASVEYPATTNAGAFKFSGSTSTTIVPGAAWNSDILYAGSTVPAGEFWLRFYVVTAGTQIPSFSNTTFNGSGNLLNEGCIDNGGTDDTGANTGTAISNSSTKAWRPDWVAVKPTSGTPVSILVLGDSLNTGQNSLNSACAGIMDCLLNAGASTILGAVAPCAGYGFVNYSKFGRSLLNMTLCTTPWVEETAAAHCKYVYIQLGRNDVSTGTAAATILSNLNTAIARFNALGCRVVLGTIGPHVSVTTDNFATVAGQTADTNNSICQAVNSAIRAGISGVYGICDWAQYIEDGGAASPTGRWKIPGTTLYTGSVTSDQSNSQFTDTSANFSTAVDRYAWVQWLTGLNHGSNQGGQEISSVQSTTQITLGSSSANAISVGDTYQVAYSYTSDGTHPSTYGYNYIASQLSASSIFPAY